MPKQDSQKCKGAEYQQAELIQHWKSVPGLTDLDIQPKEGQNWEVFFQYRFKRPIDSGNEVDSNTESCIYFSGFLR